MALTVEGKFRKVRIKSLSKKYGMYRGVGKITIEDTEISIEGRHVMSLGARWGIGILIMIASLIVTLGYLMLGLIPIYLLMEYVILKREDLSIPCDKLTKYALNPKKKLVGLEFQGPDWTSPAILRTEQFQTLVTELRSRFPEKDAMPNTAV